MFNPWQNVCSQHHTRKLKFESHALPGTQTSGFSHSSKTCQVDWRLYIVGGVWERFHHPHDVLKGHEVQTVDMYLCPRDSNINSPHKGRFPQGLEQNPSVYSSCSPQSRLSSPGSPPQAKDEQAGELETLICLQVSVNVRQSLCAGPVIDCCSGESGWSCSHTCCY